MSYSAQVTPDESTKMARYGKKDTTVDDSTLVSVPPPLGALAGQNSYERAPRVSETPRSTIAETASPNNLSNKSAGEVFGLLHSGRVSNPTVAEVCGGHEEIIPTHPSGEGDSPQLDQHSGRSSRPRTRLRSQDPRVRAFSATNAVNRSDEDSLALEKVASSIRLRLRPRQECDYASAGRRPKRLSRPRKIDHLSGGVLEDIQVREVSNPSQYCRNLKNLKLPPAIRWNDFNPTVTIPYL